MEEIKKNNQTSLDFEADGRAKVLQKILDEINNLYPLINEIIKDRVSYDGEYFYIDDKKDKKMTEEEFKSFMKRLNEFEEKKLEDKEEFEKRRKVVAEKYHVVDKETIYEDSGGVWRFIKDNGSVEEWDKKMQDYDRDKKYTDI